MRFDELNLHPLLLRAVEKNNFQECTAIQAEAIPHALNCKDVAGLAQTGTGKTAAFLLPMMDRILRSRESSSDPFAYRKFKQWSHSNFILVLVPTRELASQVFDNIKSLDIEGHFKSVAVYGGTSYEPQKKALAQGVDFVIATPGRLIDLFKDHVVDLKQVVGVVFDEADRMFDMGFKDDMKYILSRIPRERQFLVFSATLNFDVLNVAYEFGADPIEVNIDRDQSKAENVEDHIFHVGGDEKPSHLLSLLKKYNPRQAIIFTNFKSNVELMAHFLRRNKIPAMGISSLLSQAQRLRVMSQFKSDNEQDILVATDVAARGLDIKGVDLVINYELPDDSENYVHRIGRTGRAGEAGKAFSLVSDRDVEALTRIENYLESKIVIEWMEAEDLVTEFEPMPKYLPVRDKKKQGDGRKGRGRRPEGGHKKKYEHRDRASGRHGKNDKKKTALAQPEPSQSAPPTKKKHKSEAKRVVKGKGPRRSYRSKKHQQQPKTIGQKIKKFLGHLFEA